MVKMIISYVTCVYKYTSRKHVRYTENELKLNLKNY